MSWWDSGPYVTIGDEPADALKRALRKAIAAQGRPSGGELVAGLAAALRRVGADALEGGHDRRLLWLRVARSAETFELGGEDTVASDALSGAFARFVGDAAKIYRRAFHRKVRWQEILETLDFVVGGSPPSYLTDPQGWDFANAWAGWVDTRGAFAPQDTLDALATALHDLFPPPLTLEDVAMRLPSGEVLRPMGGRGDATLAAEVALLVRGAADHGGASSLDAAWLASVLARAIGGRRERLLGGASCERCEIVIAVRDPRPRVRHPRFGEGIVLGEDHGASDVKLRVSFADGVKVLLKRAVTAVEEAPRGALAPLPEPGANAREK
jgi:hypothetical protein